MPKRAMGAAAPTMREVEWRRVLAEQERSGLSVAEFARRRGVSAGSLGWWRYVARRRAAERRGTQIRATGRRVKRGRFVEVRLAPERRGLGASVAGASFEVVTPGGCMVRVPVHFDADVLRRLLTVLGASC